MAMRAPEVTRRLLVEMRAQLLIDNLNKQISGGDLALLSSVNSAITAIDAAHGEAGQKSPTGLPEGPNRLRTLGEGSCRQCARDRFPLSRSSAIALSTASRMRSSS